MSGHTPGPWVVQLSNSGPRIYGPSPARRVSRDPIVVGVGGKNVNESRANARLIAASPDLLAACEALVLIEDRGKRTGLTGACGYCTCSPCSSSCPVGMARAALEKAGAS